LRRLPRPDDPRLLVGNDTSDDAGVYQLTGELALVATVDFFTPIVDDPATYGRIAAANALSDVYAMGGQPLLALSIVAFPAEGEPALMEAVLRGGLEKMAEAGCTVAGGHSIRDEELKFGYAVTGLVDPRRIWRNVGAQPGDLLLLTKPIGTGVIATALKSGKAAAEWVAASVESMARLNRDAAEALRSLEGGGGPSPLHAVTDVTGFGLLGHAREIAVGSQVSLEIDASSIEYLPGAAAAAAAGCLPGGLVANEEFLGGCVEFGAAVKAETRSLLFDPQTSGGLLISLAAAAAQPALEAVAERGITARQIGRVVPKGTPLIRVG
jgi:selenide,water dikinase